jgi:hypothetical protein
LFQNVTSSKEKCSRPKKRRKNKQKTPTKKWPTLVPQRTNDFKYVKPNVLAELTWNQNVSNILLISPFMFCLELLARPPNRFLCTIEAKIVGKSRVRLMEPPQLHEAEENPKGE